jgi:hypothetical protein
MGIDLICKEKVFSCSYGFWNTIRTATILATLDYLKSLLTDDLEEGTYPYVSLHNIIGFMDEVVSYNKVKVESMEEDEASIAISNENNQNNENNEEIPLISLFLGNCSLQVQDLLITFGVSGLYALCNKMDCEGCYSVGNSYDIIEFFKLIRPFIINDNDNLESLENEIYKCLLQVEEVFQESVDTKQSVMIR